MAIANFDELRDQCCDVADMDSPIKYLSGILPDGLIVNVGGGFTGPRIPARIGTPGKVLSFHRDRPTAEAFHAGAVRGDEAPHNRRSPTYVNLLPASSLECAGVAPDSADYVRAVRVLPYVEDKDAFLANMANALRPGGKAYFDFFHSCSRGGEDAEHELPTLMTAAEVLEAMPANVSIASVSVCVRHYDGNDSLIGKNPHFVRYDPQEFLEVHFHTSPDQLIREAVVAVPGVEEAVRSEVRVEIVFTKQAV